MIQICLNSTENGKKCRQIMAVSGGILSSSAVSLLFLFIPRNSMFLNQISVLLLFFVEFLRVWLQKLAYPLPPPLKGFFINGKMNYHVVSSLK